MDCKKKERKGDTDWLSPLFAHMAEQHDLILTESELGDIMDVCIRIQKYEAEGAQ